MSSQNLIKHYSSCNCPSIHPGMLWFMNNKRFCISLQWNSWRQHSTFIFTSAFNCFPPNITAPSPPTLALSSLTSRLTVGNPILLQYQPQPRNWQSKHVTWLRGPAGSCKKLLPWVFTRKSRSGNVPIRPSPWELWPGKPFAAPPAGQTG